MNRAKPWDRTESHGWEPYAKFVRPRGNPLLVMAS